MTPNSYSYLLFLLLAACLFWALPRAARMWCVLAISLIGYAISDGLHIAIPLAMTAAAFLFSRLVVNRASHAKLWCGSGITVVLAILVFFKYRDFAVANLNLLLLRFNLTTWDVPPFQQLPLGISFCAFTAIAFLIDTYQGRIKNQSITNVATLLCFWPTAMAGPILRYRELGSQLSFKRAWDRQMLIRGLDRIVWGLVQKNLIANNLESWVREGFMPQAAAINTTVDNWFLALAFGLQIYFDFASYSNLAIGAAQLIGVNLPENFRFPYHAANPAEFWSRWHMSLSRWIRDYLFFPLSVRFREAGPQYFAALIGVMAIVGLWHGAGWGFVAWGVMHALYLIAYRIWQKVAESRRPALAEARAVRLFWRLFMLAGAMAAWVPFRAATLAQSGHMLRSMLAGFRFSASYSVNFYLTTLLVAAFCIIEPFLCSRIASLDKRWAASRWAPTLNPMLLRPALYALGLFLFIVLDDRDTGFIYFQF